MKMLPVPLSFENVVRNNYHLYKRKIYIGMLYTLLLIIKHCGN